MFASMQKEGFNALHVLCAFNKGEDTINVIRLLVSHKIDINSKSGNGSTALDILHRRDDTADTCSKIIQLLLELGALD